MGADIHQTQARDNPEAQPTETATDDIGYCIDQYLDDTDRSEYCQFAAGWYEGYSLFIVVETVAGSKGALQGAPSADDVRRVLDDAGDNFNAAQGLRQIDNPETKTGQINYRIITDGGRHVEDVSPQFRTAGKNAKIVKRFTEINITTNDRVLELRTSADASELESIRTKTQSALNTRQLTGANTHVDEIRLVATDGTRETISIDPQS